MALPAEDSYLSRAIAGVAVAATLSLAACGGGGDGPPPVADPLPASPGQWSRFVPVASEIDGKQLTPTCSGFPGTDASFHFWAKRGTTDKLVVFFEGGGACWDGATCSLPIHDGTPRGQPALYKSEILPSDDPRALGGLFDPADPRNPVKDWSYVYVPYCTGDVHGGSKTTAYSNPFDGQSFAIEHRGADNFALILRWIRDNFRAPEQLLVTGTSAGGYGATLHFPAVREAFPGARAAMLADASQGVMPDGFVDWRRDNWNFQVAERVFGNDAASLPTRELIARMAARYPDDRIAQYTTSLDLEQMAFYDVMVNGVAGTQGTACMQWADRMRAELAIRQQAPNFRSYLAAGTTHTLLGGTSPDAAGTPLFFRERSAGAPFTDWLAAMLSPSGAGWTNLGCTNCETLPFPCPL